MLKELFSLKQLLVKLLGLIGTVIAVLVAFFYPHIVSLISKATPEALAQIIVLGGTLSILIIFAFLIIISFLHSENKQLTNKDEYIFYFGARWRINRAKKTVYEKPFCNCPNHQPLECKLVEYTQPIKYKAFCPTKTITYDSEMIRLVDSSGIELSINEAVELIKKLEFGK